MEKKVATNPTRSEILAPYKVLERTSRPTLSVPQRCFWLGGWSRSSRFISTGLYGAMKGADRAILERKRIITMPATACLLFLN
jgi:hypothetical protein